MKTKKFVFQKAVGEACQVGRENCAHIDRDLGVDLGVDLIPCRDPFQTRFPNVSL